MRALLAALILLLPGAAGASAVIGTYDFSTYGPYGSAVWGGTDNAGCNSGFAFATTAPCAFATGTGAVSAAVSDIATGSSFSGNASIGAGGVSVSVGGVNFVPGVGFGSSYGHALVWDTLTFSGPASTAPVHLDMSGSASLAGDASMSYAATLWDPANGTLGTPPSMLLGNLYNGLAASGSYSQGFDFTVNIGTAYILAIAVNAGTGGSYGSTTPGSVTITDPFSLTLPKGVTASSAYAAAMPEPASAALLLAGLAGLVRRRVRRERLRWTR